MNTRISADGLNSLNGISKATFERQLTEGGLPPELIHRLLRDTTLGDTADMDFLKSRLESEGEEAASNAERSLFNALERTDLLHGAEEAATDLSTTKGAAAKVVQPTMAEVESGKLIVRDDTARTPSESVKEVQRLLRDVNFRENEKGEDGFFGPRTEQKLKEFQAQKMGMTEDDANYGKLDKDTLAALRKEKEVVAKQAAATSATDTGTKTINTETKATETAAWQPKVVDQAKITADAARLYKAGEGRIGHSDEGEIVKVLSGRSNAEMQALKDTYRRMYDRDLTKDMNAEARSNSAPYRQLISKMLEGKREEGPVDPAKVTQDVIGLKNAMAGNGTIDRYLIQVAATRSPEHMDAVAKEFGADWREYKGYSPTGTARGVQTTEDVSNPRMNLEQAVKGDTTGWFEDLVLANFFGKHRG